MLKHETANLLYANQGHNPQTLLDRENWLGDLLIFPRVCILMIRKKTKITKTN